MQRNQRVFKLVVAALLCAVGILVPIISPVKINLEPASFTLASHVALFIAMFLSPKITLAVWLGTTVGFQLAGFAPVVVARAASQLVFALAGSIWLQRHPHTLDKLASNLCFGLATGLLHGVMEVAVVLPFYFSGSMAQANYDKGFAVSVLLLVGLGTVVHSMVDCWLAQVIYKPVSHMPQVKQIAAVRL